MALLVLLGGCMQHRGAAMCSITVQSAAHVVYSMVLQWLQGGLGRPIPTPTPHRGGVRFINPSLRQVAYPEPSYRRMQYAIPVYATISLWWLWSECPSHLASQRGSE